jgi:hypothetical protein
MWIERVKNRNEGELEVTCKEKSECRSLQSATRARREEKEEGTLEVEGENEDKSMLLGV